MYARMRGDSAEALLRRYTAPEEVMEMPGHCGACGAPCMTRMFQTEIPFFKARPPNLPLRLALTQECSYPPMHQMAFPVPVSWHLAGL